MFTLDLSWFIDSVFIFILAFIGDIVLGEYPDRIHPTVGIGRIILFLKKKAKDKNPTVEKANGVLMALLIMLIIALSVGAFLLWVRWSFGSIPYIIAGAFLFKATFAIRGMGQYTRPIATSLKNNDVDGARKWLPYIVRRDPKTLNERQIISAAVESIAESTTDGITAPFFFYAILGVPGAFAYRVINTLDSMVGYKNPEYRNIGWFSAKTDTLTNYLPARATAYLMVLSAMVLRKDWRESWRILQRDKHKTVSPNAGFTISAMAGALNIQLEKKGYYTLGDDRKATSYDDIGRALKIMTLTATLFAIFVVLPVLVLKFWLLGF